MEFSKPGFMSMTSPSGGGGTPMVTIDKITQKAVSDDKMVKTLLLGVAGFSDGAQYVQLDFHGAIPLAGFETDFIGTCLAHGTVDTTFRIANIITVARGRITDSTATTDADAPNGIDGAFTGFVLSRTVA